MLSAWWSCFFNDRWFDKEHALCIALHSLEKSERGLAGKRNCAYGNVSGIWFHVKGFVYDNHMPAPFLLTASCCDQIREQFLTCRFQLTISRSTLADSTASKDLQLGKISVPSMQCSTGPYTLRCHTNLFDILLNEQYQLVLTVRLQSDPVGRRLGLYCQMSDGLFSISAKGYFKNIENHEHGERIWHQSICQNSKHSREAENTVLLDAKNCLGDIDSITLNETSTNLFDHLAEYICHKGTETLWRMLRSTSLVW